jgi:hypothetical protein
VLLRIIGDGYKLSSFAGVISSIPIPASSCLENHRVTTPLCQNLTSASEWSPTKVPLVSLVRPVLGFLANCTASIRDDFGFIDFVQLLAECYELSSTPKNSTQDKSVSHDFSRTYAAHPSSFKSLKTLYLLALIRLRSGRALPSPACDHRWLQSRRTEGSLRRPGPELHGEQ